MAYNRPWKTLPLEDIKVRVNSDGVIEEDSNAVLGKLFVLQVYLILLIVFNGLIGSSFLIVLNNKVFTTHLTIMHIHFILKQDGYFSIFT